MHALRAFGWKKVIQKSNTKRYRPNECISEPAMAFKVDGRGYLNKHHPLILGNYWHFTCPVGLSKRPALECDTNYSLLSLCLLFMTPIALSTTYHGRRTLLE